MRITENPQVKHEAEILRVADRYRNEGYRVIVEPEAGDIPDFIKGYKPDIIATGNGTNLVIEVKGTPVQAETYRKIADTVDKQPGWSFRLVAVSSLAMDGVELEVIDTSVIERETEEAEALFAQGYESAAFLLAWRAAEAAMRRLVVHQHLAVHRGTPREMMGALLDNGYIDYDQYGRLIDISKVRSAVAHGYGSSNFQKDDLIFLRSISQELLADKAA